MWPPKSFTRWVTAEFNHPRKQKRSRQFHSRWLYLLLVVGFLTTQFVFLARAWAFNRTKPAAEKPAPSRFSKQVSVRAADRSTSALKLGNGRDVLSYYAGPPQSQEIL